MATPQPGIFAEGSAFHYFLEYSVTAESDPASICLAVKRLREQLGNMPTSCVIGFGDQLWRRVGPEPRPAQLIPAEEVKGWNDHDVPATQRDLWVWIHGSDFSENFDCMRSTQQHLSDVTNLELDLVGFTYRASQDLTGFIDGTANPKGDECQQVALIPEGDAGDGGTYALTQKWVHNLAAFEGLSIPEQEKVIGRTKVENVELEGDAMPPDSHVARTDFSVDGVAQKIYRRSAPYGSATEQGLYFVAFALDPDRFRAHLDRMFGQSGDGVHDQLIEFSRPETNAVWFVPSLEDLDHIGG
jgi:putative iron-dependent peroxidase